MDADEKWHHYVVNFSIMNMYCNLLSYFMRNMKFYFFSLSFFGGGIRLQAALSFLFDFQNEIISICCQKRALILITWCIIFFREICITIIVLPPTLITKVNIRDLFQSEVSGVFSSFVHLQQTSLLHTAVLIVCVKSVPLFLYNPRKLY